jgi:hypothetical protein
MCIALVLADVTGALAAPENVGLVKRANGDVFVQRAGERMKADRGTPLFHGDRLVTGKNAYAYVEIRGAAPLAIGPDTEVAVDRFSGDEKQGARRSSPGLLESLASYLALNRQR